ncbi:MAG: hypothetical protein R3D98_14810 [Candidatus Krumholzibacteriia bacterium]
MDSGLARLLDKGGPWAQSLFIGAFAWLATVLILVIVQRRQLTVLLDQTLDSVTHDEPTESAVARFRAGLTGFAGGQAGLVVVLVWWVFAATALAWSHGAAWDVARINDAAYMDPLLAGSSVRGLVRIYSAALITRSLVGITSVPPAIASLLAVDQIWLRPTAVARRAPPPAFSRRRCPRPRSPGRADARWSWSGLVLNWVWLVEKRLVKRASQYVAAQIGLVIVWGVVVAATGLTTEPPRLLDLGEQPTAVKMFWLPLAATALLLVPGLLLTAVGGRARGGRPCVGRWPETPLVPHSDSVV